MWFNTFVLGQEFHSKFQARERQIQDRIQPERDHTGQSHKSVKFCICVFNVIFFSAIAIELTWIKQNYSKWMSSQANSTSAIFQGTAKTKNNRICLDEV